MNAEVEARFAALSESMEQLRQRFEALNDAIEQLRTRVDDLSQGLTRLKTKQSEQEDRVRALDRGMRRGYPRGL